MNEWRTDPGRACAPGKVDPDEFHGADGDDQLRVVREARAQRICRTCPVMVDCAIFAVRTEEPFGVWGGLTRAQRRSITRSGVEAWVTAMRRRQALVGAA